MGTKDAKTIPKILITVLTHHERSGWVHPDLMHFIYWTAAENDKYATHYVKTHNFIPAAAARNFFCKQVKDSDADWLLMIDNDMSPPANLLDTIKGAPADAMVVTPRYHMWDGDINSTRLCWGIENPKLDEHGRPVLGRGFHELDKCGTGSIFIRPQLFNQLPMPWFFYTYDQDGGMTSTEDIQFCIKVREHGFKIYGNADITCGHSHNVNLAGVDRIIHEKHKSLDNGNSVRAISDTKATVSPTDPAFLVAR